MTSRLILALLGASCLCACKSLPFREKGPDIILDEEEFIEAIYLDEAEPLNAGAERVVYRTMAPTTMPGQLKPIPASVSATPELRREQAIDAANAQAVAMFLDEKIQFLDIPKVIEQVCDRNRDNLIATPSLQDILDADRWARTEVIAVSDTLTQRQVVALGS